MDQNSTKVAPAPTPLNSPAPAPVDPLQTPVPVVSTSFKNNHPELYKSWVEHIQAGYRNNDQVFQRILDAFMRSHTSTVIMYWVLFGVGVGFFVVAASLALFRDALGTSMVFGGLSIVAFLTYFVSGPPRLWRKTSSMSRGWASSTTAIGPRWPGRLTKDGATGAGRGDHRRSRTDQHAHRQARRVHSRASHAARASAGAGAVGQPEQLGSER
ncbi:MAG: hypothetical protein R3A10_06605 [Caldilineaceae bacterium]